MFYVLFLYKVLGAGDVKLLGICMGFLGVSQGTAVIFCGLVLALIVEIVREKRWNCGYRDLRGVRVRLAPYILAGYCMVLK